MRRSEQARRAVTHETRDQRLPAAASTTGRSAGGWLASEQQAGPRLRRTDPLFCIVPDGATAPNTTGPRPKPGPVLCSCVVAVRPYAAFAGVSASTTFSANSFCELMTASATWKVCSVRWRGSRNPLSVSFASTCDAEGCGHQLDPPVDRLRHDLLALRHRAERRGGCVCLRRGASTVVAFVVIRRAAPPRRRRSLPLREANWRRSCPRPRRRSAAHASGGSGRFGK